MKESRRKSSRLPKGFYSANDVQWAALLAEPPSFVGKPKIQGAMGRGILYERKVHDILEGLYGSNYVASPWFLFSEGVNLRPRHCQPDGILFDFYRGLIVIVEIKYNHCALAWWQLYTLYLPVVRKVFGPTWNYACCEVVKWYDPATVVPRKAHLQKNIEFSRSDVWSVNICNPKRVLDAK